MCRRQDTNSDTHRNRNWATNVNILRRRKIPQTLPTDSYLVISEFRFKIFQSNEYIFQEAKNILFIGLQYKKTLQKTQQAAS